VNSIGKRRQRVRLQAASRAADGAGGSRLVWADVAILWAEIIALKSRETLIGERHEARQSWRVVTRWRAGVTSDHRLIWGPRVLAIHGAVDPDGQRRWLAIDAEEGIHEP